MDKEAGAFLQVDFRLTLGLADKYGPIHPALTLTYILFFVESSQKTTTTTTTTIYQRCVTEGKICSLRRLRRVPGILNTLTGQRNSAASQCARTEEEEEEEVQTTIRTQTHC